MKKEECELRKQNLSKYYGMKPIGKDREGNNLYPGDSVLIDEDIEDIIEYGKYRDLFDCGYVIGYYIPDYCIKIFKNK